MVAVFMVWISLVMVSLARKRVFIGILILRSFIQRINLVIKFVQLNRMIVVINLIRNNYQLMLMSIILVLEWVVGLLFLFLIPQEFLDLILNIIMIRKIYLLVWISLLGLIL